MAETDREANRFSARAGRYASVGANVGGVAARMAMSRLFGKEGTTNAAALAQALGGLKGPIMKVAQLLATVPDLLPPEYAAELQKLQADAPPMGAAFVRRRMQSELGAGWQARFGSFDLKPAAAASLGQVHRASTKDGVRLACKLQYPDMQSAVEADLKQLEVAFALHRRMNSWLDTREIAKEIGARVREELDYEREAKHADLYAAVLKDIDVVRVPRVFPELSTKRLLTLGWLDGDKILGFAEEPVEVRNRIAQAMFKAWWHPFSRAAVIHGDPHLGNYTVFSDGGEAAGINLLDYGCVRIFHPRFVGGVVDLYRGLLEDDEARIVHAYEVWGFENLDRGEDRDPEHLGALHLRSAAGGSHPNRRGRGQARRVWPSSGLRGASSAEGARARDRAAGIRVHGSRRGGSRRRLPPSEVGAELPPAVRGGDRAFLPR